MARGIKEGVLIGGGAVLVLLTVLLLISLRQPVEPEEVEAAAEPAVEPPGSAASAPRLRPPAQATPAMSSNAPPAASPVSPRPAPRPVAAAPDQGGAVSSPREPHGEVIKVREIPHVSHVTAPAAEPSGLEDEPDPQRRKVLRRMHKLAVAKMRQGVFTRRAQMLEQAMAEGKASGTWSKEEVRRAEQDLKQLEENIKASGADVEEMKKKVDEEIPPE